MKDDDRSARPRFPLRLDALGPVARSLRSPGDPVVSQAAVLAERAGSLSVLPSMAKAVSPLKPGAAAARAVLRPQRPVEHAHSDAARSRMPTGLGLDSADVRRRMVARLQAGGLRHPRLVDAIATVPRHEFVDAALVTQAYEDTSLPIGHGQTISKPSVVARMLELLLDGETARRAGALGRVLEIGTGCGYQAALLAMLGTPVVSIERLRPLHDKARALLGPMRRSSLRLLHADGMLGHAPGAPYDSIVSAAGGDELPAAWLEQLAVGGRIVAPLRQAGSGRQTLIVVDRHAHGFERTLHESVHFVPLKSGVGGR